MNDRFVTQDPYAFALALAVVVILAAAGMVVIHILDRGGPKGPGA